MPEQVTPELKHEILNLQNEILSTVQKYAEEIKGLDGKIESTVQTKIDKLNTRLDTLELKAFQPMRHATEELNKHENPERKEAYNQMLRKGAENLKLETKTLIESDATLGGFFIPPEYNTDIVKSIVLISPVRQYARIRTTQSNEVRQPKRTSTPSATWGPEAGQQTEMTGLKYGLDQVPNHLMTAFQDISNEDLEDSMFDLAGEINSEIAEQFAKAEGAAFVNGTSKGQPEGFMSNAAIATDITNNATGLTYQGFVDCAHNMKTLYAQNATWFLNRQTIGQVRLLVDGQNRPLWLPFANSGLAGGNAPTILGIPYAEIPDMPQVAAGSFPVALGDWKRCYLIVDRINISMMRDPYSQSSRGVVRFLARKRVGGQVILTEGIRKIMVSTNSANQSPAST